MKKWTYLSAAAIAAAISSVSANAGETAFSINYANSSNSIEAADYGQGLNVKVNYDPEFSNVGFVSSATFTEAGWEDDWHNGKQSAGETRHFSLAAGPSYWFQPFMAIYALAGVSEQQTTGMSGGQYLDESDVSYVYGGGLRMNVYSGLIIDAHYEYSPFEFSGVDASTETYSVGLGWRF